MEYPLLLFENLVKIEKLVIEIWVFGKNKNWTCIWNFERMKFFLPKSCPVRFFFFWCLFPVFPVFSRFPWFLSNGLYKMLICRSAETIISKSHKSFLKQQHWDFETKKLCYSRNQYIRIKSWLRWFRSLLTGSKVYFGKKKWS